MAFGHVRASARTLQGRVLSCFYGCCLPSAGCLCSPARREGWRLVEIEKPAWVSPGGLLVNAGNHLRSHTLTRAVPSAQRGLTSVFGMGTGVTLAVWSPANLGVLRRLILPRVCSDNLNRAVKTHL